MQPLKIEIEGDYFDCQIYRGRLYLWTFNGALEIVDWNKLINSLIEKGADDFVMTSCFTDGSYLYKASILKVFSDKDFKEILDKKFRSTSRMELKISSKILQKYIMCKQDVPGGELPIDTEIYSSKLYFINDSGLHISGAHKPKSSKYLVSSKPSKIWDCRLLSLKASKYPRIALSGGDEGLFELSLTEKPISTLKMVDSKESIYHISEKHSSFSNYSFLSIYNTSLVNSSYLAEFKLVQEKEDLFGQSKKIREYDRIVDEEQIFTNKHSGKYISWGIEDKIYRAIDGGFEIVKYNNFAKLEDGQEKFTVIDSLNLHSWKGNVINGGTTYFGNIIECENAIVVMMSNKDVITIPGPITRWRVYPRSHNYENQLHVINEKSIEIYAFYHDYFVNDSEKEFGIVYREPFKLWKN